MQTRTINIELIKLDSDGSLTSFESPLKKALSDRFKDAGAQRGKLKGEVFCVYFTSFSIGLVENVLVSKAKCRWLARFSQCGQLCISGLRKLDSSVKYCQQAMANSRKIPTRVFCY